MTERLGQLKAGDWGMFFGWDPELVPDLPSLTATYLDTKFSATVPIVVIGQSGHVAWVNTPSLKIANVRTFNGEHQQHNHFFLGRTFFMVMNVLFFVLLRAASFSFRI